jgi:hypothetical protein
MDYSNFQEANRLVVVGMLRSHGLTFSCDVITIVYPNLDIVLVSGC